MFTFIKLSRARLHLNFKGAIDLVLFSQRLQQNGISNE